MFEPHIRSAHKVEHKKQDAKLMFVAVGGAVVLNRWRCSGAHSRIPCTDAAAVGNHHWSSLGGSMVGRWETPAECRALFADFDALSTAPKVAKRLQLLFSQTTRCLKQYELRIVRDDDAAASIGAMANEPSSDPGVVNIFEVDDLFHDEDHCLTDGAGRISLDLARGIPSIDNGRKLVGHEQRVSDDDNDDDSAPAVVQGRLYYQGSLAKGLWIVDASLPEVQLMIEPQTTSPAEKKASHHALMWSGARSYAVQRTILVGKQKQRKVAGRPDCAAVRLGIPSFEVIKTFERDRKAKLDVYLATLLEVAMHDNKVALHKLFLDLQRVQVQRYLHMLNKDLNRALRKEEARKVLQVKNALDDPGPHNVLF